MVVIVVIVQVVACYETVIQYDHARSFHLNLLAERTRYVLEWHFAAFFFCCRCRFRRVRDAQKKTRVSRLDKQQTINTTRGSESSIYRPRSESVKRYASVRYIPPTPLPAPVPPGPVLPRPATMP
jgi:cytidylate kinase